MRLPASFAHRGDSRQAKPREGRKSALAGRRLGSRKHRLFSSQLENSLDFLPVDWKIVGMERALSPFIQDDLARKMVFLSGPRQAGKTTLARALAAAWPDAQVLNWDVAADRRVMLDQSWSPAVGLLVFDELHKMADWRAWLKGVFDGRREGQAILVTGSARLDAFRQGGESLAGRYFAWRLHPFTVKEWMALSGAAPEAALARALAQHAPQMVLMPHALDAQPTHRRVQQWGTAAIEAAGRPLEAVYTEFWSTLLEPNLLVMGDVASTADLVRALACHVGEVTRNPYHQRLPADGDRDRRSRERGIGP